jgi:diguanylate cyclase (GGDEF)-like protein
MFRSLHSFLANQPARIVGCLAFALIIVLAGIDKITGYELSISVFYLIPISIAAWYGSRLMGYIVSGLSAGTWMIVEATSSIPYSQSWILFWNSAVRMIAFVIVAYLIAELRTQLQRQEQLARTDNLTGLLNRAGFFERAQLAANAASRYGYAIAIAYIDLDGFKKINDTLGHLQGDEALKAVGDILGGSSRDSDVVARIGGDEFVVLLPDTTLAGAHAYFDKLHLELRRGIRLKGWSTLDLSIGAVVYEEAPFDLFDALRAADNLMYRAKRSGKTGVVIEGAASPSAAAVLRAASADA